MDTTSNAVQPDIIVILTANEGYSKPDGHFYGVPDLIVEILSPGNKEHDLVKKKDLYERFGVTEYWIVDPQTKISLGYCLQDTRYVKIGEEKNKIPFKLLNLTILFWLYTRIPA